MYKKYGTLLVLISLITLLAYISLKEISLNRVMSDEAFLIYQSEQGSTTQTGSVVLTQLGREQDSSNRLFQLEETSSEPRLIQVEKLNRQLIYTVTQEECDVLMRIVEAEAGGEDYVGKLLVANVVLNRVRSDSFPDNIIDVVYQNSNGRYQFSPVGSGRIDKVTPSEETVTAVLDALRGVDESEGALYFAARRIADQDKMKWFDTALDYLFAHGGHEFFTE